MKTLGSILSAHQARVDVAMADPKRVARAKAKLSEKTTWRKIGPSHPSYQRLFAEFVAGMQVCMAYAHNSRNGCPNPKCWKWDALRRKP